MLGEEDWVATHGCLLSIVGDDGRRKAFGNEVHGMAADGRQAFVCDICTVFRGEVEAAAEGGLGQTVEEVGEVVVLFGDDGFILCIGLFGDDSIVITEEAELYGHLAFVVCSHSYRICKTEASKLLVSLTPV